MLVRRLLEHRHLLHVRGSVLLRDYLHAGGKEDVAPVVVAVRVRVDDVGDGLVGDRLDLIENALPVVRVLGVDQDDALLRDVHAGVATPAEDEIEIVGDLFDLAQLLSRTTTPALTALPSGCWLLLRAHACDRCHNGASDHDGTEHIRASHSVPSIKNNR